MSFEPKVNVLLVDDHPENLLVLEAILDSLGQNLVRATSGAQALRRLLNQDFAVILLDVQMPEMDGFETAELIRQRERSRHTPIIFLTAFNTSDNMVFKGYSLGAVDYLFKPIEPEILKSKVAAFVDLFQKSAEVKRQAAQLTAMNAELKKREEMFRSLSACSPVGIFLTDTEGKCTYTNPRYQAIYGMTQEESLGEGWVQTIHLEDRERVIADWYTACDQGREYKGEFRILTSGEIQRWVYVSSSPMLSTQGQVIGYVGTLEDITERKQAEKEHIKLIREQTAREEAETANRLKDEFLATLSHELRTPLTSILGWARLMRQRKLDEKAIDRAIETIERNASLQAQLIEDILDVSRIIRGKLHLNLCPVNLVSVISAVLDSVRLEADAKNIQLEYLSVPTQGGVGGDEEDKEASPLPPLSPLSPLSPLTDSSPSSLLASPFLVSGDSNRLQQIIWNLVSNAIKFTSEGGRVEVRLSVELGTGDRVNSGSQEGASALGGNDLKQLELGIRGIGTLNNSKSLIPNPQSSITSFVQITVNDTGSGISPDFLPHVFEHFRQADGSITRNQGGLGLGLAIVRYLVQMHGGSVRAHSPGVGQGSTFTVKLPLLEVRGVGEDEGDRGGWRATSSPSSRSSSSPSSNNQQPFGLAVVSVEKPSGSADSPTTNNQQPTSPHHFLSGLHVLVVDDDTDTRDYVCTVLQQCGATVTSVASVSLALLALEQSQPDVLVSDIGMPEEDGYTLIRKVRNLEPNKGGQIPAIALTAYVREQDCTKALESGFHMYVSKPVEPTQLINSVAKLAQRNHTLESEPGRQNVNAG